MQQKSRFQSFMAKTYKVYPQPRSTPSLTQIAHAGYSALNILHVAVGAPIRRAVVGAGYLHRHKYLKVG